MDKWDNPAQSKGDIEKIQAFGCRDEMPPFMPMFLSLSLSLSVMENESPFLFVPLTLSSAESSENKSVVRTKIG